MTDKEMHKLSRRELLQLLLTQGKETEKLRQSLAAREEELQKLTENYERLKKRLDYKDEQISGLKKTLYDERTNRKIELDEAGSLAEAALRLNGVFDVAQKAAEQYLYNIRLLYDKKVAEYSVIEGSGEHPDEIAGGNTKTHLVIEEKPGKNEEADTVGSEGGEEEQTAEAVPETENDKEETGAESELEEEADFSESLPEGDKSELSEIPEEPAEAKLEKEDGESPKEETEAESEPKEEMDLSEDLQKVEKDTALEEVKLEEDTPEELEEQSKSGRFRRWRQREKHSK